MANSMLKEFHEVSEVLKTLPNVKIWSFLEMAIICFASCCTLLLINFTADFTG